MDQYADLHSGGSRSCSLSGPITRLIFPGTNGVGGQLLILGGITIILNGNSNITNGVLQGIGKPKLPMIHAAIALVADVIAMALLLVFTNLGVYTIVIAQIVYAVVMCLLNDRSIKKYMGYKNPWRSAYLSPFLASIPMGGCCGSGVLRSVCTDPFQCDLPRYFRDPGSSCILYCISVCKQAR